MPRYFLKELSIEGFRGINNQGDPLRLKFNTGKVNSIFARNAFGKSSTFEALSFAIRGVVPKLAKLPASDDPSNYYVNRFHAAGTSTVVLTFGPDDGSADVKIEVNRAANGTRIVSSPSGHATPTEFLNDLVTDLALLDYETFLDFVNDTPLKRGRTFSGLLGLSQLSEFRQALEVLSNQRNLNTDFDLETQQRLKLREEQLAKDCEKRLRDAFRAFLSMEPDPILDLVSIDNTALHALKALPVVGDAFKATILAEIDFEQLRTAIKTAEASDKRDRLSNVLRDLEKTRGLSASATEAEELSQMEKTISQRDIALTETRGALFHDLYETVNQLFVTKDWTDPLVCPACESGLDFRLDERTQQKLQQYKAVDDANSSIKELWTTCTWPKRLKDLEDCVPLAIPQTDRRHANLGVRFSGAHASLQDLEAAKEQLQHLESTRVARIAELAIEKETLESELPPSLVALTEQVEHAAALQKSISEFKQSSDKIAGMSARHGLSLAWATFVQQASNEFARAEVKLSTVKTSALETDYRAMYEQVTSNPEIVPMLKKADTSEELHLKLAKFYGLTNLSASTLLPESYRNALAICIYLSTALQSSSPARFMVLDDVTSSFDAGHQWSLMELIRTRIAYPQNPSGPQVIILSHDGLLEKYFDTMATETNWHHQHLQGMPPKGLIYTNIQDVNRIGQVARQHLSAGQSEAAVPLIRQYLEQKLLQVIRKLEIPVPLDFSIRDDRKMVKNCLDAITDAIILHQKAGSLILSPQQVQDLNTVHVPSIIGNWVSHYSTASGAGVVSPYVFLGVLDTIEKLADCFKYSCNCSGGPQQRFYRTLSSKPCKC